MAIAEPGFFMPKVSVLDFYDKKSFTNDESGFKELLVFAKEAMTEFDIAKEAEGKKSSSNFRFKFWEHENHPVILYSIKK